MENIIEPNESFDFSKLSLAHPSGIQGGAYFTKIEYNAKPLYIQTTKSLTRQGIVKTGKKYYCDLMFDKNSESLINWFENLEEKCQKLIFEKRDSWFQNSLEENDIESAFNSLIRVYKSGKYYLVRVNIKNNLVNEPAIKIYNENHNSLTINDITNETNLISILEIQGIKFTSRNFQIEIELKQAMVLDKDPIFDNFLIKTSKNITKPSYENVSPQMNLEPLEKVVDSNLTDYTIENNNSNKSENIDLIIEKPSVNLENTVLPEELFEPLDLINNSNKNDETESVNLEIEDLNDFDEDTTNLKEIDIDVTLENDLESLKLKKPNQVYYELYKEARNKAKLAKKNAIISYLEAKNIKKTYMIENINDSDSDFDAEIDEVSESELEGL
uniref:Uncharacterized protein n=1 Tax=viral metagenome TaxID=1070528 RepID=A0A6C0EQ83_9ZZZZ